MKLSVARLACALVVVIGAGLRLAFLGIPAGERTDDELFYTRYANRVALNGPGYVATFVRHFNADPAGLVYPWPNRVGYVTLVAGAMKLSGRSGPGVPAAISVAASILVLILLWRVGLATLGPWPTAIGLLLLAAAPGELAVARRGWQDALVELLAFAMTAAFIQRLRDPNRARWVMAFYAIALFALLVKESLVVVFGLGTLGLAWLEWRSTRSPRSALALLAGGAASALLAFSVVAWAAGGIGPLRAAWTNAAVANAPNAYMIRFQTGSPLYYARGLARLEPVLSGLAGLAVLLIALRIPMAFSAWKGASARGALTAVAWLVAVFFAIAAAYPQKNLRFLSPLGAPAALLAGALVWSLIEVVRARAPAPAFRWVATLVAVALTVSSVADLARFRSIFLERRIPDLTTPMLEPRFRLPP